MILYRTTSNQETKELNVCVWNYITKWHFYNLFHTQENRDFDLVTAVRTFRIRDNWWNVYWTKKVENSDWCWSWCTGETYPTLMVYGIAILMEMKSSTSFVCRVPLCWWLLWFSTIWRPLLLLLNVVHLFFSAKPSSLHKAQ